MPFCDVKSIMQTVIERPASGSLLQLSLVERLVRTELLKFRLLRCLESWAQGCDGHGEEFWPSRFYACWSGGQRSWSGISLSCCPPYFLRQASKAQLVWLAPAVCQSASSPLGSHSILNIGPGDPHAGLTPVRQTVTRQASIPTHLHVSNTPYSICLHIVEIKHLENLTVSASVSKFIVLRT